MKLSGVLTAGEGFADFLLDLIICVAEKDARIGVAGRHFRFRAFKGREEDGMDDGRFHQANARSNVTALAEVRVLIDGTGNQARDLGNFLGIVAEDKGEACGKGGG